MPRHQSHAAIFPAYKRWVGGITGLRFPQIPRGDDGRQSHRYGFLDAAGSELGIETTNFNPRSVPGGGMPAERNFLVVDADDDATVLLVRILMRDFPQAAVVKCRDAERAVSLVKSHDYDAIVAHRAVGTHLEMLIRAIRESKPGVLLVAISGCDRSSES